MGTHRDRLVEYTHGDRVLLHGQRGAIYRCQKKDGSGSYWKVKLDSGAWVWPDDTLRAESTGQYTNRCAECSIPFFTDKLSEVLCPNCDRRGGGRPAYDPDAGEHGAGQRAKWDRQHRTAPVTPRRDDDDEIPF